MADLVVMNCIFSRAAQVIGGIIILCIITDLLDLALGLCYLIIALCVSVDI